MNNCCGNDQGFTLLEIIAVLVILSILTAIAVPKYVSLDQSARERAIDAAISELNGRETLTWSNHKITSSGYLGDDRIFGSVAGPSPPVDYHLGSDYTWSGTLAIGGGTITFKKFPINLTRVGSTTGQPGWWSR